MTNKQLVNKLRKMLKDESYSFIFTKLIVEQWNAETPHFGGTMPHRYDDGAKECAYCGRPKNYVKKFNPGYIACMVNGNADVEG